MLTTQKTCFKCGESKPYSEFYKHPKMADGHLGKCKECTKKDSTSRRNNKLDEVREYDRNRPNAYERGLKSSESVKQRRKEDDAYREKVNLTKARNREKFPGKTKARNALSNAIRDEKVHRPSTCSACNASCTPHGHHWSYEEEHWLDVRWLCTECHGREHKRLNKLGRNPSDL